MMITDETKLPIFLERKIKLQRRQAVVAILRMKIFNPVGDSRQVLLVPKQLKFCDFRLDLYCHKKWAACESIVEYFGRNGVNPAGNET